MNILNSKLFKSSKTTKVLQLHGLNSSINSKLEQSIKKIINNTLNLNKDLNITNYSQNMLYGHFPGQTKISSDTTLQKILNKSIVDLSQFNEQKSENKILVGTSTGAYLILNWLEQNPKNNINLIILFKPLIDINYTFNIFSKLNTGIESQLQYSEFKILNNLYGSKNNKFNLKSKNNILISCGDNDEITGNKKFIEERITGNYIISELKNSIHRESSNEEYTNFENFIKQNLKL